MKTNRAINGIIRKIQWLGEIFHHEDHRANPAWAEQSRALVPPLPQIPGDQSNCPSSSSFHMGSWGRPHRQKSVFSVKRCSKWNPMERLRDREGIFVCPCSFLGEGLGLGMAPGPEFSWKFYLMLKHDPSLKLIEIFI